MTETILAGPEQGRQTYRDAAQTPYPFCPGCGHGLILNQLDAALVHLQLDPRRVVIVSDIGCAGLGDQYFDTHAFHALHGRSITYATGMKLADPELTVIVLMGDGGCGIGGHHLLNAARRNIGITVIVFNNLNFGMTGGEHSVTTPTGSRTATTRLGNLERPLDICGTVMVNGAGFVARQTAFDRDLAAVLAEAIAHPGFALVDIWELCAAYFVPNNQFNRKTLEATMAGLNFPAGVLQRNPHPELSRAYRQAALEVAGKPALPLRAFDPNAYASTLSGPFRMVIAGAAGQRIRTAARAFAGGAALSGLQVTQRDDYPVTVMTGFSLSEVILSPQQIGYMGVAAPDLLVISSAEGLARSRGYLAAMQGNQVAYVTGDLLPLQTGARVVPLDPGCIQGRATRRDWGMLGMVAALSHSRLYPLDALRQAIRADQSPEIAEANLRLVDLGIAWAKFAPAW